MRLRFYLLNISDTEFSQLVSFLEDVPHRAHVNGYILLKSIQNELSKTFVTDELSEHVHQLLKHFIRAVDVLHLEPVNLLDLLIFKQELFNPVSSCFWFPLEFLIFTEKQALIECNHSLQSLGNVLSLGDIVMLIETFSVDDKVKVSFTIQIIRQPSC